MQIFKRVVVSLLLVLVAASASAKTGAYRIDYKLPNASDWKILNSKDDAKGYMKFYKLKTADPLHQVLMVNYGSGIKAPVIASMNEISSVFSRLPCKVKKVTPVKTTKDTLIFTSELNQCQNGRSMWQVQKVFNAKDGQYSVSYAAGNANLPAATKKAMTKMITDSSLQPAA